MTILIAEDNVAQRRLLQSLLLGSMLALGFVGGSAQTKGGESFTFEQKRAGHIAKVVFITRLFDPARHRITKHKGCPLIDGRVPYGTDCTLPHSEIAAIWFYFDRRKIKVPKKLYADCFFPPFAQKYVADGSIKNYFALRIGDDLQSAFAFMSGGDTAGSYQVVWVLRQDGRHARFSGACPDCGFIDFNSGFFYEH
jgi:hypothetical protein